jgi:hypothetical protein
MGELAVVEGQLWPPGALRWKRAGDGAVPSTAGSRHHGGAMLAVEAADNGLLAPELANGITRVKGVQGVRLRNWLTTKQARAVRNATDATTRKGLRNTAILAVLLGCGLQPPVGMAGGASGLVGEHGQVRTEGSFGTRPQR